MKFFLLLLAVIFFVGKGYAQNRHKIDSLKNELIKIKAQKSVSADTTRVAILNKLCNEYTNSNNDTALVYARQALALSQTIGFKKGIEDAYSNIGLIYIDKRDFVNGIKNYLEVEKLQEKEGDKKGLADTYRTIGDCYTNLTNYPQGLSYFLRRLKIYVELKDKGLIADAYNDVGIIYYGMKDYDNTVKIFNLSIKYYKEAGVNDHLSDQANTYNNMGRALREEGNYDAASDAVLKALKISLKLNDTAMIAYSYSNMCLISISQGKYTDALNYITTTQKMDEQRRKTPYVAEDFVSMGTIYEKKGELQKAISFYLKALSTDSSAKEDAYKGLANVYAKLHNYKGYYDNEILYRKIADTLLSNEKQKKITSLQMQYNFDKQEDSTRAEQIRKDTIAIIEIKNQKRIRNYVLGGLCVVLFFLVFVFLQRNRIAKEKKRSEGLLLNILPAEVANELKAKGSAETRDFEQVTVMFTDFKNFTKISEQLSSTQLVAEINYCFSAFDNIVEKYGIEKIKTIGDSYMCAGGLPVKNTTNAVDVIKAAIEIRDFMVQHKNEKEAKGELPFEIRIGVHTGPVVAGIVGVKKFAYDIWGDTVNLASRMESSGVEGQVNISDSTYQLVKDKFTCTHRGKVQTKSKGEVDMYFVS